MILWASPGAREARAELKLKVHGRRQFHFLDQGTAELRIGLLPRSRASTVGAQEYNPTKAVTLSTATACSSMLRIKGIQKQTNTCYWVEITPSS